MNTIYMPSTTSQETFAPEDPINLSSNMEVSIDMDIDLTAELAFEREDDYMAEDYQPGSDQDPFQRLLLQGRDDDRLDGEYPAQEADKNLSVPNEHLENATYLRPEETISFLLEIYQGSELEVNVDLTSDLGQTHELENSALSHARAEFTSRLSATGQIDVSEQPVETTPSESQRPQVGETGESSYDPDDTGVASYQYTPSEVLEPVQATVQGLDSTWDALDFTWDELVSTWDALDSTWNGPIHKDEEGSRFYSPNEEGAALSNTFLIPNGTDSTYLGPILPVTLIYREIEMSLFPPADGGQTIYFLSDEGLLSQNIDNFFEACRNVLAGSIEDEEKLEFSIDDLGLTLSESTIERPTVNLAGLISLYLQLQSNDGVKNPRPLRLTLRTKYEFSTRWKYIKSHLAEGKGLSQLTEESQPLDLHIDHGQFKQPHLEISKTASETELRGENFDNTQEIDDGGLSPALFEDAGPDSLQHKATTPAEDWHEGELYMETLENRSQQHPLAAASFDASINAQGANSLTGDVSYPQLDVTAILDQKHSSWEHGDLIDYDNEGEYDEEYNYPGTSTDPSTIQGYVLETVADRLDRLLNVTTMSEHEDDIARLTALESDPTTALDDQLLRTISDGKVDEHPCVISNTDEGRNWNSATKYHENRENLAAFKHLDRSEMNLIVESGGYKADCQGTESSTSVRELQARRESNDGSGTRYNQGDSIISMGIPEARQREEFIHENTGLEPCTSPVNGANENENEKETLDTRGSFFERTAHTPARVEDLEPFIRDKRKQNSCVDLLSVPKNICQIQTPRSTENPQGKPADDDEIAYEGGGNDPEPSGTYPFKRISQSNHPLKRTRSDLEDSDPVHSSPKGEEQ